MEPNRQQSACDSKPQYGGSDIEQDSNAKDGRDHRGRRQTDGRQRHQQRAGGSRPYAKCHHGLHNRRFSGRRNDEQRTPHGKSDYPSQALLAQADHHGCSAACAHQAGGWREGRSQQQHRVQPGPKPLRPNRAAGAPGPLSPRAGPAPSPFRSHCQGERKAQRRVP